MGFELKKADVQKMMKDFDRDGSGKMNFEDFSDISKSSFPYHEQLVININCNSLFFYHY